MDYKKDSRLQIIIVCVVLALLLAWYFRHVGRRHERRGAR